MKRVLFSGTIFLNLSDRLILALFFCFIFVGRNPGMQMRQLPIVQLLWG